MNLHRNQLVRTIRARPRLFICTAIAFLIAYFLPHEVVPHRVTRWLIAWNCGTLMYVVLATVMMIRSQHRHMQRRAQLQDDGQFVLLALVVVATVASLAAIAGELTVVKDSGGFLKLAHAALAGLTVLSSWAFIQVMFTLHYAHEYYAAVCDGRPPGLQFPDSSPPYYGDFFYFAAIIGTSGQTADVSFVSQTMRRVGSMHCILSYLFNTTVLALLINIGASLI